MSLKAANSNYIPYRFTAYRMITEEINKKICRAIRADRDRLLLGSTMHTPPPNLGERARGIEARLLPPDVRKRLTKLFLRSLASRAAVRPPLAI